MEEHDIELVRETVRACMQGTPVSVYDNYGDLCSFKLEDIVSIKQAINDRKITYITLSDGAICVDDDGESQTVNPVTVTGTAKKWCSRLGFKTTILNDED